jgi:hypothetical protein
MKRHTIEMAMNSHVVPTSSGETLNCGSYNDGTGKDKWCNFQMEKEEFGKGNDNNCFYNKNMSKETNNGDGNNCSKKNLHGKNIFKCIFDKIVSAIDKKKAKCCFGGCVCACDNACGCTRAGGDIFNSCGSNGDDGGDIPSGHGDGSDGGGGFVGCGSSNDIGGSKRGEYEDGTEDGEWDDTACENRNMGRFPGGFWNALFSGRGRGGFCERRGWFGGERGGPCIKLNKINKIHSKKKTTIN